MGMELRAGVTCQEFYNIKWNSTIYVFPKIQLLGNYFQALFMFDVYLTELF